MSYTFFVDYKKHITPKTKLVFDLDQICFAAAAAAEKHYVRVTHKKSGKHVPYVHQVQKPVKDDNGNVVGFEEETVKSDFDNKTQFYGRGKQIGGYLKKLNDALEEKGKATFEIEDFEVEDVYEPFSLATAIKNAEAKITKICNKLGIDDWMGIIDSAEPTNFRLNLTMPVKYKSNRADKHRPVHLKALKEHFRGKANTKVVSGMESDDYITMYAFKAYQSYKKTGFFYYLPVSFDKDNLGTPHGGLIIYNQTKVGDEFKYDYPFIIKGLGNIWMKGKSETMADGFMQICRQMLLGDWETDGFMPRSVDRKIRFGETACYKALSPCTSAQEAIEVVNSIYRKWFPDGVKFTDYEGVEREMSVEEWQEIIFQCLYMKHDPEDKTTWSYIVKKFNK